jgi:hypothetical protein
MIKTLKVRGISLFFLLLKFYQQTEFCVLPKKTETWYLYWFDIFLIVVVWFFVWCITFYILALLFFSLNGNISSDFVFHSYFPMFSLPGKRINVSTSSFLQNQGCHSMHFISFVIMIYYYNTCRFHDILQEVRLSRSKARTQIWLLL